MKTPKKYFRTYSLIIYTNLGKFNFAGKFSTWFYRIVYNQSISYIRTIKKIDFSLNEFEDIIEPKDENKTIDELLADSETAVYLEKAIAELLPEESAILHLYYYDEKKVSQISDIIGLSEPAIKTRLFRIRKKTIFDFGTFIKKRVY